MITQQTMFSPDIGVEACRKLKYSPSKSKEANRTLLYHAMQEQFTLSSITLIEHFSLSLGQFLNKPPSNPEPCLRKN